MKSKDPVFIAGFARCGTSMLYRALLKHSAFTSDAIQEANPFLALSETHVFRLAGKSHRISRDKPEELKNYMLGNDDAHDEFLHAIHPIQRLHQFSPPRITPVICRCNQLFWKAECNATLMRAFFFFAEQARGAKRILEKSPSNYLHLKQIKSTFPRCRMLFIFRHPIDAYTSFRKRFQRDPKAVWADISPLEFSRRYAHACATATSYMEKSNNLLMIRYESFTENTEAEIKRILEFLNEPFEEQTICDSKTLKTQWLVDPDTFGSIVRRTKNWESYLNKEEAAFIETRLSLLMQKLSYSPYSI